MKKKGLLIFCLTLGLVMASVGIAMAFTHDHEEVNVASATVTGATIADMTVTIKNVSNDAVATEINWSGLSVGVSTWTVANQYIEIDAESTYPGWGIQIYTNNVDTPTVTVVPASPKYTGIAGAAGLVGVTDTTVALPMAWHAEDDVTTWGTSPQNPEENAGSTFDNGYLWQADASENLFTLGDDYITIWNGNGIRWGYGPGDLVGATSPIVVYLGAKFTTATVQSYKTNTIILEQYHQ